MPDFQVRWLDPAHGLLQRRMSAPTAAEVAARLGVPADRILAVDAVAGTPAAGRPGGFPLRAFSQELAVLLDAGIPMLEALQALQEKDTSSRAGAVLDAVVAALREGHSMSRAMADRPDAFDAVLVALVAANERTGRLANALHEHAAWLGWVEQLRNKVKNALVYPALLLAVGAAVVAFLLVFVLPRFSGVFDGFDRELPWATRQLIALSHQLVEHPGWAAGALATAALGIAATARSPALRARLAARAWRAPWFGPTLRGIALARVYRTLGILLGAGLPALQVLDVARGSVAAPMMAAMDGVRTRLQQGQRLSDAFDAEGLATPVALRMLRVGERSGQLAGMFGHAAAFHDGEVQAFAEFVTRVINPLLMLVMGVLIGGIVVLMYLPIFQLVELVQ